MKQLYLLLLFWFVALFGLPTRALGQCATRPPGADRYTAIDAGLLTACNPLFTDTKNNSPANCFGNFFESTQGGFPSDEIFYKFTLASPQKVTISHCGSGFDTYMSLLDGNGNVVAVDDDFPKPTNPAIACTPNAPSGSSNLEAFIQQDLPPGTYYVVSEGYGTNSGNLTTQISVVGTRPPGATLATAIEAGTLSSCGALYSDTQANDGTTCFGNDYDQALNAAQVEGRPTDDIFYKFTLTSKAEVTIGHCTTGLAYNGRDPDTYIHLLDATGKHIVSDDDYGPACPSSGKASLKQTLEAGTYYVVSELYNSNSACKLTTAITTSGSPALAVTTPTTSITAGGSATLTASGASSYIWAPATGLSATTGSSVTASPTRTTTYTVTSADQTGCAPAPASITVVVSSIPTAPVDPADDLNRNWTRTRVYDLDGKLTGDAKQFSDALGRPTQSQVKNIAANQVFATQVVNNLGGQPVLSTLPAPTNNQEFKYKDNFITANNAPYSAANFEGLAQPAAPDSASVGTLGYYYSRNNAWEPATAATRQPFSLSEPMPGPLGGVRRAAGPGDKFRMGAGHESRGRDFPLLNELDHYSSLRPTFIAGSSTSSLRTQGVKVVSVNPNGVESIAFANREGQAVASCLSGDQYPATTLTGTCNADPANVAGSPAYQDIHVGASASPTPVTVTGTAGFVVIDLLKNPMSETAYSGSQTLSLVPGFYRLLATSGQFSFSYPVHYGNFSYNYYDDAGRVVATVAPNGLPGGSNFVRNASFDQDQAMTRTPTGWQTGSSTTAGASYTENFSPAHSGTYYCGHYQPGGNWSAYTYQVVKNLPNGLYTLRAWVENTGAANITAYMQAQNYGGALKQVALPDMADWMPWRQITLTDIAVTNGQCEVGFTSTSSKGAWIRFDDVELVRQADSSTPTFVTRNVYDTAGRLLQTTSPDEGATQYVYARDGRIRFSQSARQLNEGKFSYSNYDGAGRVVESGEYQMANDRSQGVVFESPLALSARLYEAEQATLVGASATNVWPGYSGSGFVGYIEQAGTSSVKFTAVNAPVADNYAVEVRYAVGTSDTRTLSVYCNSTVQQVSFPTTGAWGTWSTQTLLLPLQAGSNTIEFRYGPADNGRVNLDYIRVLDNTTRTANSVLADNILEDRTRLGGLDLSRCSQRNQVWYDQPFQDTQLSGRGQDFVLGAVAKTSKDGATTWYSYNDLGQLTWMVQEKPVVGIKTLDYTYDAAGNVLKVAYQQNQADAFYHHYLYDANQRLTQVFTSPDGATKTLRASYSYYLHGPLKRVELAGNLQGIDYAYTVQGWLKSINNSQRSLDPGQDGPNASGMFKDLFGMRLDYFDNDYRSRQVAALNPLVSLNQAKQRYDGTIRAASWRTAANPDDNSNANKQAYGIAYLYDTKGQLLEADFATVANGSAFTISPTRANGEDNLSYDANGNIGSLRRTSATGAATDNFSYQYLPGTNKLTAVNNPAGAAVLDYDYDATGQMTRQRDEQGQRYLKYDVTGKVLGMYRTYDSYRRVYSQPLATFTYDDKGFRASKASYNAAGQLLRTTYSVRDMQGNEVSTYVQEAAGALQRSEVALYGASRLGALVRLDDGTIDPRYELNDHLGNARVVFHKPTTDAGTETVEGNVPAKYAFQGADIYRAAPASGGHNGSTYVAELNGSSSPATLRRVVTVQKGDTITFTAWAKAPGNFAHPNVVATPSRVKPFILFGAAGLNEGMPARSEAGQTAPAGPGRWLGRIAVGLSIPLARRQASPAPAPAAGPQPLSNYNAWIQYQVKDANGNNVGQPVQAFLTGNAGNWQPLQVAVRVQQGGTVELTATSADGTSNIFFDDLTVEQTGGMIVQEQHTYGYGAPLAGLNYVIGTKKYRHGYQGQFAEKDEETGTDDFELRLYDSRIGRWTAPDPAGQHYSPYVGMGNNPVSGVDPDGGFDGGIGAFLSNLFSFSGQFAKDAGPGLLSNLGSSIGNAAVKVGSGLGNAAVNIGSSLGNALSTVVGAVGTYGPYVATGAGSNALRADEQGPPGTNQKSFPSFSAIEKNYQKSKMRDTNDGANALTYYAPWRPCGNRYGNQCAIRLSAALQKAGLDMSSYDPDNKTSEGYARGAFALKYWLSKPSVLGPPQKMSNRDFQMKEFNLGHHGIMYIEAPRGTGASHIDIFFDGGTSKVKVEARAGSGFYAGTVYFWIIP